MPNSIVSLVHGNLLGGAIGETTQTAAQFATIAATAAQTVVRMRTPHLEVDRARDHAAADAECAALRNEHAAARLRWSPAFDRSFSAATAAEATAVWSAARPWVDHDPTAHEAARRAEERLGVLHPELMARYQLGLADGMEAVYAMVEATTVLAASPGDVNAAAAAGAVAGDERGEALMDWAVPDVAATVSVDERTQGVHVSATHAGASDVASARAALLAAAAYPQPLRASIPRVPRSSTTIPSTTPHLWHNRGRRPAATDNNSGTCRCGSLG